MNATETNAEEKVYVALQDCIKWLDARKSIDPEVAYLLALQTLERAKDEETKNFFADNPNHPYTIGFQSGISALHKLCFGGLEDYAEASEDIDSARAFLVNPGFCSLG